MAIVVLNWNGGRQLVECLEAVRRSDYSNYRIVVADNGSTDDSIARFRSWAAAAGPIRVVEYTRGQAEAGGVPALEAELAGTPPARGLVLIDIGGNLGYAAGNNVALRYALARGFEDALLLNNDAVVEPEVIGALAACLRDNPGWAGAAPKILERANPGRILYAGGALRLWQARAVHRGRFARDGPEWSGRRVTGHLTGCCALFRMGFFREAGLLDEDFFFGQEDVALSCVAKQLGWELGVDLDQRVYHSEGWSLGATSEASIYYYNKYRLLLLAKHGSPWQVGAACVFMPVSRALKFAALLVAGRFGSVRAELRAYRDFFAGRLRDYDRERAIAAR